MTCLRSITDAHNGDVCDCGRHADLDFFDGVIPVWVNQVPEIPFGQKELEYCPYLNWCHSLSIIRIRETERMRRLANFVIVVVAAGGQRKVGAVRLSGLQHYLDVSIDHHPQYYRLRQWVARSIYNK